MSPQEVTLTFVFFLASFSLKTVRIDQVVLLKVSGLEQSQKARQTATLEHFKSRVAALVKLGVTRSKVDYLDDSLLRGCCRFSQGGFPLESSSAVDLVIFAK